MDSLIFKKLSICINESSCWYKEQNIILLVQYKKKEMELQKP